MAESTFKQTNEPDDEEDYMGDLSKLLPPEDTSSSKSTAKKLPADKAPAVQSSKKKPKIFNWQEQRRKDREQKQFEEDEQTLARIEAAPIPQSNIGFKMLKQMGYTPGVALGKEGSGLAKPVGIEIRRSRAGIGREDPIKEQKKQVEIRTEKKRSHHEALMEEFGSRQKLQWRSRRIVVNYHKAKAALDQLENKEVVEPEKKDNEEEGEQEEEEEEEIITEKDLEDILMRLRDEHHYCLFCGYQYDSTELLISNCPGINEDDH